MQDEAKNGSFLAADVLKPSYDISVASLR